VIEMGKTLEDVFMVCPQCGEGILLNFPLTKMFFCGNCNFQIDFDKNLTHR